MHQGQKSIASEVLFQKMGNTWFAFTEINGEMMFTALPAGIDPRKTKIDLQQIIEDAETQKRPAIQQKRPEMAA